MMNDREPKPGSDDVRASISPHMIEAAEIEVFEDAARECADVLGSVSPAGGK